MVETGKCNVRAMRCTYKLSKWEAGRHGREGKVVSGKVKRPTRPFPSKKAETRRGLGQRIAFPIPYSLFPIPHTMSTEHYTVGLSIPVGVSIYLSA